MVRRWSYINEFNFYFKNKKFTFFKKSSKKRVFKLTVSTRKFYKKYTKFRRKAFNRLRHKTNWIIYSNIFKFWSFDYLVNKSICKRYWLYNMYKYSFLTFNWNSLKNTNIDLFCNYSYNVLSFNSFLVKINFANNNNTLPFFFKKMQNSSLALIEDINDLDDIAFTSLAFHEGYLYDFSNDTFIKNIEFFHFFNSLDALKLNYVINMYKLIIYLSLSFI